MFMVKCLFFLIMILMGVAFITLIERKILSLVGLRLGPYKVSAGGLLQPIGDAVKLMNKSTNFIYSSSLFYYYLCSSTMFLSMLILWTCSSLYPSVVSLKLSALIFLVILGLNSLNSVVSGWSTCSKYSILGSMRTVAQLVSYEASLYMCMFFFFCYLFSYNFCFFEEQGLCFFFILCPPCFFIWIPSMLAELNRTPYDFSEGESELVSGFNIEFGSCCFTLIFLAEYGSIFFFCFLSSLIFFNVNLYTTSFLFVFLIIWVRSVLPRFRYDKLMLLSWKFFVPFLTCIFLVFIWFVEF